MGKNSRPRSEPWKLDQEVFSAELECIHSRWQAAYKGKEPDDPRSDSAAPGRPSVEHGLVGLAFSGGGIRSATINMGIAQALFRRGVFDHVDYLSTVSGGGYLGSSISTLMREPEGEFPYQFPYRPEASGGKVGGTPKESPYLTWVRNHSNYLIQRGFLDYLRMIAVLLRGVALNFLTLLPLLLLATLLLAMVYGPLLLDWKGEQWEPPPGWEAPAMVQELWAGWLENNWMERGWIEKMRFSRAKPASPYVFTPWVALLVGLWYVAFPVITRARKARTHERAVATGSESSVKSRDRYELSFGQALLAFGVVGAIESIPYLIHGFHQLHSMDLRGTIAGLAGGSSAIAVAIAGKLRDLFKKTGKTVVMWLVGLLGLILPLLVVLYAMEFLIYKQVAFEIPHWVLGVVPGLLALFLVWIILQRLARGGFRQVAWLIGLLVVVVATAAVLFYARGILTPKAWFLLVASGEIWLFCWLSLDVNQTSIHPLYRDRLASAYLVGVDTGGQVDIEEDIDLHKICQTEAEYKELQRARLAALEKEKVPERDLEKLRERAESMTTGSKAPYHLINVAFNLQGSDHPGIRERLSDFFVFSKRYYGGPLTGYCSTRYLEAVFPQMDLATAMAISAAAASPNMGAGTSAPLVAMMTLFNIRLGYWVPHPGELDEWARERKGWADGTAEASLHDRFNWRVPPRAFLKEMRSRLDEKWKWVNLSDGGHIENLAIIELLRRRCKYIIAGDGEADPGLTFAGLATLIRYARLDLGIEIDIPLDDLRLGENRRSHQHAALGKITYPAEDGGEQEEGYLLYIKSSYTGDEDEVITEYRARCADFPHESTADQFFDEGQFEAYRALGYHMADGLFPSLAVGEEPTPLNFEQFEYWFSCLEAGLAPRLAAHHVELQERLEAIQSQLRREENRAYFYQVYPELAAGGGEEASEQPGAKPDSGEAPLDAPTFYLASQQLALIETAFNVLNLGNARNRKHEGNLGWMRLFHRWAKAPSFRRAYALNYDQHGRRFQLFCDEEFQLTAPKCD